MGGKDFKGILLSVKGIIKIFFFGVVVGYAIGVISVYLFRVYGLLS